MLNCEEALRELLIDSMFYEVLDKSSNTLDLYENKTDNYIIHVLNVPDDSVVLKFDNGKKAKTGQLYRSESKLGQSCDYVIITPSNNKVVFIELGCKSKGNNHEKIVNQLTASLCLFCYIAHALNEKCHYNRIKCSSDLHYAAVCRTNTPVPIIPISSGRTPGDFKKIEYVEHLPYLLLIT